MCLNLGTAPQGVTYGTTPPNQFMKNSDRWLLVSDDPETVTSSALGKILSQAQLPFVNGSLQVRTFLWHLLDQHTIEDGVYTLELLAQMTSGTAVVKSHVAYFETRSDTNYGLTGQCIALKQLDSKLGASPSTVISIGTAPVAFAKFQLDYTLGWGAGVSFVGALDEFDLTTTGSGQLQLWVAMTGPGVGAPGYGTDTSTKTNHGARGAWPHSDIISTFKGSFPMGVKYQEIFQFAVSLAFPTAEPLTVFPGGGTPGGTNQGVTQNTGLYGVNVEVQVPVLNLDPFSLPVWIYCSPDPYMGVSGSFGGAFWGLQQDGAALYDNVLASLPVHAGMERLDFGGATVPLGSSRNPYTVLMFKYAVGGGYDTPGEIQFCTISYTNPSGPS